MIIESKPKPTFPAGAPPEVEGIFNKFVETVGEVGTEADAMVILMLATSWLTWRKATAEVARLGLVVSSGGTAIPNPHLAIATTAHRQVLELCKELGLTPAARKKLAPPEGYDDE